MQQTKNNFFNFEGQTSFLKYLMSYASALVREGLLECVLPFIHEKF